MSAGDSNRDRLGRQTPPSPAQGMLTCALTEAIELERERLMKAESLLDCLLLALKSDDHENEADAPYFPTIVAMIDELVTFTIDQLDSQKINPHIQALVTKEKEK